MTWSPPTISLKWGSYFAPDADDDTKLIDSAIAAHDGGIITLRSAVERCARTFNIENIGQYLETLKEERAAKQAQLAADMHAMGGDPEEDDDDDEKPVKRGGAIVGKTVTQKPNAKSDVEK